MDSMTSDILFRAEETLKTTEFGLDDLIKGPKERKLSGLRNLIVFGRAVTNVLQNLRATEPDFDKWYNKYVIEMKSDELMSYFYKLRSEILKEGVLKTAGYGYIKHLNLPADLERLPQPPVTAKALFIGDNLGGSGWEIQLPDGSIEKYYIELPSDIGFSGLCFPKPPKFHLGQKIEDESIEALSILYLDYLRNMVNSAKERFSK